MSAVTVLHSSTTFTTLIYSHPEKKGKDDCFLKQKVTNKFQTKYIYLKKNLYNKSGNIGACIEFIIITQFSAPYSSDNPGDSVYNF